MLHSLIKKKKRRLDKSQSGTPLSPPANRIHKKARIFTPISDLLFFFIALFFITQILHSRKITQKLSSFTMFDFCLLSIFLVCFFCSFRSLGGSDLGRSSAQGKVKDPSFIPIPLKGFYDLILWRSMMSYTSICFSDQTDRFWFWAFESICV